MEEKLLSRLVLQAELPGHTERGPSWPISLGKR
jgi:hypothetical protein